MKNKSYIGISFIVLIFGIWTIKEIKARYFDSTNLIEVGSAPSFQLTDQNGAKISDKDYIGKVYVLEFFFSTCPSICPKMNKNMLQIQEEFAKNSKFGIASITINPENDTPKVLKEHATKLGAKMANWHFLTGDKSYIFNLANKGFNLYVGENKKTLGNFEHSGLFALIDKNGNIRCRKDSQGNPIIYYDGLEQKGINAIKEDIKTLLKE